MRAMIDSIVQRRLPEHTEEAERSLAAARNRLRREVDDLMQKITQGRGAGNGVSGRD